MDYLDYERLARLKLKEFVSIKYGLLRLHEKNESPDLIGNELVSIGVEVTRAITTKEGRFLDVINYCISRKLTKNECLLLAQKKNVKLLIECNEFGYKNYKQIEEPIGKIEYGANIVTSSIISKINKFKNYSRFISNELYIFVNHRLAIDDYGYLVKDDRLKVNNPFNIIYFDNNYEIYKWDTKTNLLKYYKIDRNKASLFIDKTKTTSY